MAANRSNIPKHELEILARHFLPQIQAFFEMPFRSLTANEDKHIAVNVRNIINAEMSGSLKVMRHT